MRSQLDIHNKRLFVAARNITLKFTDQETINIYDAKDMLLVTVDLVALTLLEIFSQPSPLTKINTHIKSYTTRQHAMKVLSTLNTLRKAGIIQSASEQQPYLSHQDHGFLSASIHIRMLNDIERTQSYIRAIHDIVRPGDVVVDIGTGTGVLAIAAAKAGAKRVYAVEASRIGVCAQELFKTNKVDSVIELVHGWSTQISLPEKANVFISETIGNKIFNENILAIIEDAKARHLHPNASFIPGKLAIYAVPLQIPRDYWSQYNFSDSTCSLWTSSYGINFSPLLNIQRKKPLTIQIKPQMTTSWTTTLGAIKLGEVNFKLDSTTHYSHTLELTENIKFNALLIAFSAELSEIESISTLPHRVLNSNHWSAPVIMYDEQPIKASSGEFLEFNYSPNTLEASCQVLSC